MATIRDVAKACKVSTATVSNVLNDRHDKVSAETRDRVFAAVRELRYRPTPLERNQKAILTHNLALLCGETSMAPLRTNQYLSHVLDGVLEGSVLRGWSVTIYVQQMWSETGQHIRRAYDGRCDGVIMLAPTLDNPVVEQLQARGMPLVVIGSSITCPGVSMVDIDNELAGYEATKHLLELGHRRITYLGPTRTSSSSERQAGFSRAMAEYPDSWPDAVLTPEMSEVEARRTVREATPSSPSADGLWAERLLGKAFDRVAERPTAFVCWNDNLGAQVCRALRARGCSVPRDVSLVSFDDLEVATRERPHLTTLRQPLPAIGRRAAEALIDRILEPSRADETARFRAELVVRESTRPLAPGRGDRATVSLPSRQPLQSVPMEVH